MIQDRDMICQVFCQASDFNLVMLVLGSGLTWHSAELSLERYRIIFDNKISLYFISDVRRFKEMMRSIPTILPQTVGSSLFLSLSFSVLLSAGTIDNAQFSNEVSRYTLEESRIRVIYLYLWFAFIHLADRQEDIET